MIHDEVMFRSCSKDLQSLKSICILNMVNEECEEE